MNIGIDLGGSHVGIGCVDSYGNIVKSDEIYLKNKNDIKSTIENFIIKTLKQWEKNDSIFINKIGIGVPGKVIDNYIEKCVNLKIENYDLKSVIQKDFPNADIQIRNDAKCAGLAEKKIGSLKDFKNCLFICYGTGVGGAPFYNGNLIMSVDDEYIKFGHLTLKENGELCNCGKRGCYERYASMRAFKNNIKLSMKFDNEEEGISLIDLVKNNLDNVVEQDIINTYVSDTCDGLSKIIDLYEKYVAENFSTDEKMEQLQAICIGGGFVKYKDILLEKIKAKLLANKYNGDETKMPQILIAKLGNDAGIIGSSLI